jgi:hypothetical protein
MNRRSRLGRSRERVRLHSFLEPRSTVVKRKTPTGSIPAQKKSVSKASAEKGREDSRAVHIKREKNERRIKAKGDARQLAEAYAEREQDMDRHRKVRRETK